MEGAREVEQIVRSTPWLMRALVAAREVAAPEWLIGAGAIRNAVWDRLHGFSEPSALADIDLVFFDADDLSAEREQRVERALRAREPDLPWQAKNQAAVHLWYPEKFGFAVDPLNSSEESVGTWPETAAAVALGLDERDGLTIVAPCGLQDLLGLVHRRNPRRVSVEEYERRLSTKRIAERWPMVRVIPAR